MIENIVVILDTTPPVVTFLQPPRRTNRDILVRWRSNEEATFHCSFNSEAYTNCGEGVISQWIGTPLNDGKYTLDVRATDDAGNIATPKRWEWVKGKE